MEPKDCAWMTEPMFRMFTTIHVEQTQHLKASAQCLLCLSKGLEEGKIQLKPLNIGTTNRRQQERIPHDKIFNPGFKLVSKPLNNIFFLMFKHTRNRFNSCSCQCSVSTGHLSEMTSQEENQKLNIVFRILFILLSKVSIPKKSS